MSINRLAGRSARLAGIVLLLGVGAAPLFAQGTAGRIEGIITDNQGGPVPGATVTATERATNVSHVAVTDASGSYTITPLPVGSYRVKVELSGFKQWERTLGLDANQVARIDARLEVGGVTEVVEVSGDAPVLDKSTSFMGTTIDSKEVQDLPLNGRNFTQLATLAPGVNRGVPGSVADGSQGNSETFRYGDAGGSALSINGSREQYNSYLLDGIDNNETLVNSIEYMPSPEVLEQFRVITTNAPAEFGRFGGGIVTLVTKSGSNEFHGAAYEFDRPKGLAAIPTFSQTKPDFGHDDFGATLGGPIEKDKSFFFLSYHGLHETLAVEPGGLVTVPTAKMRTGDFSELLNPSFNAQNQPIFIYNPITGQPFPGNIIPSGMLNPAAVAYLNAYPLPDLTNRAQQNFFTHRVRTSKYNDADARIDENFSANDTLFLRGSYWNDGFSDPGRIPGYQAGFGSGSSDNIGYLIGLGETHTFNAHTVNELRVGWVDFHYDFLPVGYGTNQDAALGIGGPGGVTVANGISLIGGGNGNYIEYLGDFGQYIVNQKSLEFSDALSYLKDSHSFKFGVTAIRRDLNFQRTNYGKGFYSFSDTAGTPGTNVSLGQTGYEVANMLVGTTGFTATGVPGFIPREDISWETSAFAQDDWRVNPKLTLNLGLRYDIYFPYYEANDQLANFSPATGGLVLPNQNGVPRSTVNTDYTDVGPRLGFAYIVDSKDVIRGAYGIFYTLDRGGVANQLSENPPTVVSQFRFGGPGSNVALSQPIPLPDKVDPLNPVLPQGSAVIYVPRDTKNGHIQQYSLGLERQLDSRTAALVAYVGSHGSNLTSIVTAAGFSGGITSQLTSMENIASSSYNSLQVNVRRTEANGLAYNVSYTLGHATNNSPGPYPGPGVVNTPTGTGGNLLLDQGDADFDIRHRFTFAATYPLPFARGNDVLGGWSVQAIVTAQSGNPFSVYSNGLRADVSGDPNSSTPTVKEWFNTAAFSSVPSGQRTNQVRNTVRGPGYFDTDLSLFKTFKPTKKTSLELRLEGFNIFNHPQFALPDFVVGDGTFGQITQTRPNSERQFQLAARFTF